MATDKSADYALLDELAEEFAARWRQGERPSLKEYTDRHPALADDIRELLPAMVEIEQVKDELHEPAEQEASASPPLQQLGDYRVLREIGRGGMGVVYEAEQVSLGRRVALKLLPQHKLLDAKQKQRFEREARSAAKLHHTNIVPVFGVGEHEGLPYYVMQFIQGQGLDLVMEELQRLRDTSGLRNPAAGMKIGLGPPLRDSALQEPQVSQVVRSLMTGVFEKADTEGKDNCAVAVSVGAATLDVSPPHPATGPEPSSAARLSGGGSSSSVVLPGQSGLAKSSKPASFWQSVAHIGAQVAEGLDYAHKQGIVHRDIKPSNLLLDTRSTVWITDFGLAKASDQENLTHTGDILGTLRYMPPEAFEGKADARGDVYALGLTLFEMLAFRPAFAGRDRNQLIKQVTTQDPVRLDKVNRTIPRDLATVIHKAIDREPAHRYATAGDLKADLQRFLDDEPIQARRISWRERGWRWCRRNPALAFLGGAVALLALVSTISATWLRSELRRSEEAEAREKAAKQDGVEKLWQSYLDQAKAGHYSRRIGQRFASLDALTKATRIARNQDMSEERLRQLRNEAIACLALPDVRVDREWDGFPTGSCSIDFDGSLTHYARTDRQGNVSVRRVADDVEIASFPAFDVNLDALPVFSRDGRFVAVGGSIGVKVWKLAEAKRGPVVELPFGVVGLDFSPDCQRLLYARADTGEVHLVELTTGVQRALPLRSATPRVNVWNSLAVHPDGRQVAMAAMVGKKLVLQVCDIDTGHVAATLEHVPGVDVLTWNPDGKRLAFAYRYTIYVWEVGAPRPLELHGSKNWGIRVGFNHAGDLLASCGWEGVLRLWNPRTGQQVFSTPASLRLIRFSPDDRFLAGAMEGTKLQILEVAAGREYRTLVSDPTVGKGLYYSPALRQDGRTLAVGMMDGVRLWDLANGQQLVHLKLGWAPCPLFDSQGSLWTHSSAGLLRWPLEDDPAATGKLRLGPPQTLRPSGTESNIAQSQDGGVLAISGFDYGTLLLHLQRGRPEKEFRLTPQADVRFVAVSADGQWVATGTHNGPGGNVKVWKGADGEFVKELPVEGMSAVGFSPDGKWLATNGGAHRVWKVGSWQQMASVGGGWGFAFSPDSQMLAAETNRGVIRLVDPATGGEYAQLEDPNQDRADGLTFSPDGTQLVATNNSSGSIHVWDLRAIRRQLDEMGLDWKLPAYPPAEQPAGLRPSVSIQVDLGDLPRRLGAAKATPQEVIEQANRALEANPNVAAVYRQRGRAYDSLEQYEKASADFEKSLELQPEQADMCNALAWLYVTGPEKLRAPGKAVPLAERAVQLEPKVWTYHNTLGTAYYRAGRYKDAVPELEMSLKGDQGTADAYDLFVLAMCHQHLGAKAEARECLRRGILWMDEHRAGLPTRMARELAAFRAEAEAALDGPPRPDDR